MSDAAAAGRRARTRRRRMRREASMRPQALDEFVGQQQLRDNLARLYRRREEPARGARPCAVLRAAGARQDDPGADRRARARGRLPRHLGAGDPARRRSRGAADQPAAARHPVHRRDPPPGAAGRGDPLPGDGGFSARPDHRRGAGGALDPHRPAALHPGRRDDPLGADHPAAARALRHPAAARCSTSRTNWRRSSARGARILDFDLLPDGAAEIARRARGTPRVAMRLLRRIRDFAAVHGSGQRRRGERRRGAAAARSRRARPRRHGPALSALRSPRITPAARSGSRRWRRRWANSATSSKRSSSPI